MHAGMKRLCLTMTTTMLSVMFVSPNIARAESLAAVGYQSPMDVGHLAIDVSRRTSLDFKSLVTVYPTMADAIAKEPMIWVNGLNHTVSAGQSSWSAPLRRWLIKGGFLVIADRGASKPQLEALSRSLPVNPGMPAPTWQVIPPDAEVMRSFYLLPTLPTCVVSQPWYALMFDQRLAVIVAPVDVLAVFDKRQAHPPCPAVAQNETALRTFVNILMVALATDYKKDQVHLPEILKRLR